MVISYRRFETTYQGSIVWPQRTDLTIWPNCGSGVGSALTEMSTKGLYSWPLKIEPIVCPETSVRNYQYSLFSSTSRRTPEIMQENLSHLPEVESSDWQHPAPRNKVRGSGRCEKDSSQQSGRLSKTMLVAILLHCHLSRRVSCLPLSVLLCLK